MDDGNRETAANGETSHYLSWFDGKYKINHILDVLGNCNDPVFELNV